MPDLHGVCSCHGHGVRAELKVELAAPWLLEHEVATIVVISPAYCHGHLRFDILPPWSHLTSRSRKP
ncbi:hypothetical protein NL676_013821 [Syzygium grande]|nr:hypothetical protein NL676_013821 [Syzygium grande]